MFQLAYKYSQLTRQIMEVIVAERKEVILTTDGEDALDDDSDGPSDDARKKIQTYCELTDLTLANVRPPTL